MLINEYDKVIAVCDNCNENLDGMDWYEVKELMYEQGWKSSQTQDGTWMHFCPNCLE